MNPTSFAALVTSLLPPVAVGVTLLLLAATALNALGRGASAATRHLVWHLALAGSIAIALAAPFVPAIPLRLAFLPPAISNPAVGGASSSIGGTTTSEPASAGRFDAAPGERPAIRAESGATAWRPWPLARIWVFGALLFGIMFALGHLALARLARDAEEVTDLSWQEALCEEARRCGWRSPIRLLRSARVGSPITWRARRLVVVLPEGAESWPAARRAVVLAHELAHATRGDHGANLLASLACALFWFHPLAWYGARRLRAESERACDDIVLARGTPSDEYASLLLDVARSSRALRLAGAASIGMARPSQLEGRLIAVLDKRRARGAPSKRSTALTWAALAVIALPLAALRPAPLPRDEAFAGTSQSDKKATPSEFTETATPGQRLELDLETGGSVRVTGWSESRVQVRAFLSGRDWQDTKVSLDRISGGLRLRSWQEEDRTSSSTSHRFEVQVPRRYDLRLSSAGGGIELSDVEGEFRGHTGGGEIEIRHAKGRASLTTGGGEIHVTDSDLSGSVSTGGGEVVLSRVSGGLRGTSGSGPVIYGEDGSGRTTDLDQVQVKDGEIKVNASTSGERVDQAGMLHVSRAGGDVNLDEAMQGAVISTGGGDVTVGRSDGKIDASTGGGDIEIGPAGGSVRAHTGAGRVRVTIVAAAGPEHSVEIVSGTGAAVLELPANLSARFELETAYTENHGGKTRIVSDFPLQQTETPKWDDSEGTPRRYVRGTGTAGKGGGLIFVKIVNGDITIRKGKPGKP